MNNIIKQLIEQINNGQVPEGYKKTEFGVFPCDWVTDKTLNKVCIINPKTEELPEEFIYVDLESVIDRKIIERKIVKKENAPSRAQRVLSLNDIILQVVRPYQKNNLFFKAEDENYKTVASTGYALLRSEMQPFLFQLLHSDYFVNQVNMKCTGTNYPAINGDDLGKVYVAYPMSSAEQEKIAEILMKWDKAIELYNQQIEKLNLLKSSCIKKMFPQKGKKVPEWRFKGFSNAWEQHKLGSITSSYSGGTPTAGKAEYYNGDIPFIRSGEINEEKTELFLSELGYKNSSAAMVEKGDILYALYGATSGEVSISKLKGAINQAILAIKPNEGYDSEFLVQWLRNQKENIISAYLQGGQGNLSGAIVKSLKVDTTTYAEQQQIGTYFRNLDHLITLHQRKVETIIRQRKALQQYLLNGIVRVEV